MNSGTALAELFPKATVEVAWFRKTTKSILLLCLSRRSRVSFLRVTILLAAPICGCAISRSLVDSPCIQLMALRT